MLKQRNFDGVDGIGKRFLVSGQLAFIMEMHPRSGIQAMLDRDNRQLLRVEQFHIPARRMWIPIDRYSPVLESFNRQHQLTIWKRGNVTRRLLYDRRGRVIKTSMGRATIVINYDYASGAGMYPAQVTLGGGRTFELRHEPTGELASVTLPSGHKHEFRVTPLIGQVMFRYTAPWTSGKPYVVAYDEESAASVIYPDGREMSGSEMGMVTHPESLQMTESENSGGGEKRRLTERGETLAESEFTWKCVDAGCNKVVASGTTGSIIVSCKKRVFKMGMKVLEPIFQIPPLTVHTDPLTDQLAVADSFSFDRTSYTSVMTRGPNGSLLLAEFDSLGRDATRTLVVGGRVSLHEVNTYDDNVNLLRKRRWTLAAITSSASFEYNEIRMLK